MLSTKTNLALEQTKNKRSRKQHHKKHKKKKRCVTFYDRIQSHKGKIFRADSEHGRSYLLSLGIRLSINEQSKWDVIELKQLCSREKIPLQRCHPREFSENKWLKISQRNTILVNFSHSSPIVAVYFASPLFSAVDLAEKAKTLLKIQDFNHPLKRSAWAKTAASEMLGLMFGHGFRAGYTKGISYGEYSQKNRDVPEDQVKLWKKQMDLIAADYFIALEKITPALALNLALVALHTGTPLLANTPAGNITVTLNASTPAHTDHDAYLEEAEDLVGTYAFGTWYNHGTGSVKGGHFFLPEYQVYLKIRHGTSIIWSGRDVVHGTAELKTEGDVVRIGTSIQLVEQLCQRGKSNMKKFEKNKM